MATHGLLSVVWGSAFVMVGVAVLWKARRIRSRTDASVGSWSATMGEIVVSQVRQERTPTGALDEATAADTMYYPEVRYTYTVFGKEYTGTRMAFGGVAGFASRRDAEAFLSQHFPVGARVRVFYDPQNPADAVLQRQAVGEAVLVRYGIMALLVGLGTLAYGLMGLLKSP